MQPCDPCVREGSEAVTQAKDGLGLPEAGRGKVVERVCSAKVLILDF